MIEWLSVQQLEDRLKRYPPVGLALRPLFHAMSDGNPAERIPRAPEEIVEEGLGPAATWAGLVDTMPFALRAAPHHLGGVGFDVYLPVRAGGDRVLFDAIAKLPLPTPTSVYFETLCPGPFGVARVGERDPIYTCSSREDAVAAATLLNGWTSGSHAVIQVPPPPAPWLVVGPAAGPYISRVHVVSSEATAQRLAASFSAETGSTFTVARSL